MVIFSPYRIHDGVDMVRISRNPHIMTSHTSSSIKSAGSIIRDRRLSQSADSNTIKTPRKPPSWWSPVWRGLVADPESRHRKAMGPAIWTYLYLLMYSNRKNGVVRRTQLSMHQDTGYSLRAIQAHLNRLRKSGYISIQRTGRYVTISILRWKGFQVSGGSRAPAGTRPLYLRP